MADRVALVTGASRGIGRAVALRLARDGFTVIVTSRTADPADRTRGAYEVRDLIEREGGKAAVFRADVSSGAERAALLDFVDREYPSIDLLVNNAGIEPPPVDMLDSTEDRFDNVFSVNLRGPYFLTQQVARRMVQARAGDPGRAARIVFVTSVQAYMLSTHGAEYGMTKAALHAAMTAYACRLAEHGIAVFEISPGIIETDMSKIHRESIDRMIAAGRLLTRRWGQPEEVAALVSAIARGDLDYSTGTRIEVGGGLGLQRL
jgi:NAD(P)-dependent dehydrogenase (short-subunit alcohol dehydrogenase family)